MLNKYTMKNKTYTKNILVLAIVCQMLAVMKANSSCVAANPDVLCTAADAPTQVPCYDVVSEQTSYVPCTLISVSGVYNTLWYNPPQGGQNVLQYPACPCTVSYTCNGT